MNNKVYYYNEKARAVISQDELRLRLSKGEIYRVWHNYATPVMYTEEAVMERPNIQSFYYSLSEIPIHPDWQTIVEDELTLDIYDYEQIIDLVYSKAQSNLVLKIMNNIHRIREYEYKGIKFY